MNVDDLNDFAIPFARALVALRAASDADEGVVLSSEETRALVFGLKLLNSPAGGGAGGVT